jgi:serine/threonine protein kinase
MTTSATNTGLPERIGRYLVVERIGKGAMGTVYAALDEQLGRRVAIKLMLGVFDEDPELRERFFREARITGQLVHRNIVTTYDLGEDNGRPFIVMELLDGLPLQEYLRTDAPATLDTKIDLMMQICDGLQSAHAAGVVHRDIKPSNLIVLRDGTLKVLDFGVARLASSTLTAHGMLLGTPEYMSPEQARGKDGRAGRCLPPQASSISCCRPAAVRIEGPAKGPARHHLRRAAAAPDDVAPEPSVASVGERAREGTGGVISAGGRYARGPGAGAPRACGDDIPDHSGCARPVQTDFCADRGTPRTRARARSRRHRCVVRRGA